MTQIGRHTVFRLATAQRGFTAQLWNQAEQQLMACRLAGETIWKIADAVPVKLPAGNEVSLIVSIV